MNWPLLLSGIFFLIVGICLFELIVSTQSPTPFCPKGYVMINGSDGRTETDVCVAGFPAREP